MFLYSSVYRDKYLVGCQPRDVFFPDFNHPNVTSFWNDSIRLLSDHGLTPSGLWITSNELTNFVPGEKSIKEPCTASEYQTQDQVDDS